MLKNTNAWKVKPAGYACDLQPKADRQVSKTRFTDYLVDWTLQYWKGVTDQQIFGTQNWYQ